MAISDITFIKGQGGLGTPLTGEDFISGLIFYALDAKLPNGFSTTNRIKKFTSIQDAEQAGINSDYRDATAATATFTVTAIGTNGDTLNIVVNEPGGTVSNLGTYIKTSIDTNESQVAAGIENVINAGTSIHGYTAINASAPVPSAIVTLKAPKKFGASINSGSPIVVTITGTIAGTLAQFTTGVSSLQAVWHYHIAEFFRLQPSGVLFVGFFSIPGTYTFTEIQTMQVFSEGKIRQLGIYKDGTSIVNGDLTLIQGVCNTLNGLHMPISSVLYAANISAVTDLINTLTDLNTLNASNTSVVIGQDGGGLGNFLFVTCAKSITVLGALLGTVALSKVSDSVGWLRQYNISDGFECDKVNFANGQLVKTTPANQLTILDNYKYIFLLKKIGVSGSFFNNSYTAINSASDYSFIYRNRVIDKAIRGVYSNLVLDLQSPLVLNADGTLKASTVEFFKREAEISLQQMVRDSELSFFEVLIDPNQPVLTTQTLVVTVKLLPIGVANQIIVNIGFTTQI